MAFDSTIRSMARKAKKDFPGVGHSDADQYVLLQVKTVLDNPGVKDEDDLLKLIDGAFEKAVGEGEAWAVAMSNSVRDHVVKPLVAKAREKGVDPVPAIVMQTDLSEAQITAMIESLDAEADSITFEPEVEAEPDQSPAAASDALAASSV